ncbi:HAD family hydrolase, partial [bacterium]
MNRESAFTIVQKYIQNGGLINHMLAVEAAMRFYAQKLGEDPDTWGLTGLLHDF